MYGLWNHELKRWMEEGGKPLLFEEFREACNASPADGAHSTVIYTHGHLDDPLPSGEPERPWCDWALKWMEERPWNCSRVGRRKERGCQECQWDPIDRAREERANRAIDRARRWLYLRCRTQLTLEQVEALESLP